MRVTLSQLTKSITISLIASVSLLQTVHAYQKDANMKKEFLNAVIKGDAQKVKDMLKVEPKLAKEIDEDGISAILKAAYYRHKDVIAVMLASDIELNIFEAAATGQTERVRVLIERDKSLVNAFAPDGFFPLGLAVFFGQRETVEILLAAGADVNAVTREAMKVTPLHSAAAAKEVAIARLLIAHGANVNARQADHHFTPLHEAASRGDIEFAELLIENGAEINARMKNGKTPLTFALERKQSETAAFLLKHGAKE